MASSGGSLGESMLIGFLTIPLLILFYFIAVFIHSKIAPNDYKNSLPAQDDVSTQVFEQKDPLETLKSLLDSGVLSEDEYEQKINIHYEQLKQEERRKEDETQQKLFEKLFNEKTIPLIKLIDDAKTQGVISETEFLMKKEDIISKYTEEVKFILSHKPKLSDIKFSKKSIVYKNMLESLLENIQQNDIIVETPSGQFQILTPKEWREIQKSEKASYYKLIAESYIPQLIYNN